MSYGTSSGHFAPRKKHVYFIVSVSQPLNQDLEAQSLPAYFYRSPVYGLTFKGNSWIFSNGKLHLLIVQLKFVRTPAFWSYKLGVLKRKSKTALYTTNTAEDAKVLETHWNCFASGFLRSVSLRRKIEERPRFPGNSLQLTTTDPRVKWVRLQFKSCRRRRRRFPKIHRSPINWPRILTQNLCLHLNKFFFNVLSSNPHQKRTSNTKI